jgi:hypothetical protein
MCDAKHTDRARSSHRFAHTRPLTISSALLRRVRDSTDRYLAVGRFTVRQPQSRADSAKRAFNRILWRHLANAIVKDPGALSNNFHSTLLSLASVDSLRILYPHCANIFNLPYRDFVYHQAARCLKERSIEIPILDIAWNRHDLLMEVCTTSSACIILALHNGFAHTTRVISNYKRNIVAVAGFPELIFETYRDNRIANVGDIEIVPVNRYTLLKLAESAKQNRAIICAPDFVDLKTGRCDFISAAIFRLAEYAAIPIYFVDYAIDEAGLLRGVIGRPIAIPASAERVAEEFSRFCDSVSGRRLSVARR